MTTEIPLAAKKKTPFEVPAGKIAVVLFPFDENEKREVEEQLALLDLTSVKFPRLTQEIKLGRLTTAHVLFTAVCVSTRLGLGKRPEGFKLVISPPIFCDKFTGGDGEDEDGLGSIDQGRLVDEIQKHIRPFRAAVSNDRTLKILSA